MPLNVFGEDFKKAGYRWTEALCRMDSDGDGRTNGEELGDPCCSWSAEATGGVEEWPWENLGHPGAANNKSPIDGLDRKRTLQQSNFTKAKSTKSHQYQVAIQGI